MCHKLDSIQFKPSSVTTHCNSAAGYPSPPTRHPRRTCTCTAKVLLFLFSFSPLRQLAHKKKKKKQEERKRKKEEQTILNGTTPASSKTPTHYKYLLLTPRLKSRCCTRCLPPLTAHLRYGIQNTGDNQRQQRCVCAR